MAGLCQASKSSHGGASRHFFFITSPASTSKPWLRRISAPQSAGDLMKMLGQRYVQYVNRTYRRSGTLWEGRFRSCLLQEEAYLMECHRYIELNPVRAAMVEHPAHYRWSSYRANAQGEASPFIKPHALYMALDRTPEARQAVYRELFRYQLDPGLVDHDGQ